MLRRKAKRLSNKGCFECVQQRTMRVFMVSHSPCIHTLLISGKENSLLELHVSAALEVPMLEIAARIRQRIAELGVTQVEVARATGFSTARLGNYANMTEANNRTPDVRALAKLAKALRTSTDWLLGLSEAAPIDVEAVIQRLLELDGMSEARAAVIAEASARALQLLSALPGEGDAQTRAHIAAQAAWQTRSAAKPN